MLETNFRAYIFGSSNSSALTKTGVTPQRRFILRTMAGSVDKAKIGEDNLVDETTDADLPPRLLTTTAHTFLVIAIIYTISFPPTSIPSRIQCNTITVANKFFFVVISFNCRVHNINLIVKNK